MFSRFKNELDRGQIRDEMQVVVSNEPLGSADRDPSHSGRAAVRVTYSG